MGFRDPPDPCRRRTRPDDRGPGGADLPDDELPVPRHRARRQPVRPGRGRQRLHPDHEPDAGRARGPPERARGRRARRPSACPARSSSAPARPRRRSPSSTSPRPATTSCRRRRSTAARTTCSTTRCPSWASRSRSSTTPTTSSSGGPRCSDNTKAFFGETIPNPKNDVFDIEGVSGVAHDEGVPLIIDNTVPSPYLIRPLEWGADIVVHSLTKFLGGHGNSIGGAIIDGGTFDYRRVGPLPRLHRARPELPRPRRTGRRSAPGRTSSRPASSCCATSARRSRRSTPSSSCRASRR